MIDQQQFREVLGHFATGVTVVTFNSADGDHGITVNSFASVSLDPPLVLWSVDVGTASHDLLPDAGHYAVNILTAEQEWLSNRFAGMDDLDDLFTDVPVFRAETGAPIIEDTLGYIDCTLEASHEAGDHTILVGRVEAIDLLNADADPLTFYRGSYGTIT